LQTNGDEFEAILLSPIYILGHRFFGMTSKELIERTFSSLLAKTKTKKNRTFISSALSIMCVECKEDKELMMEMRGIEKQDI